MNRQGVKSQNCIDKFLSVFPFTENGNHGCIKARNKNQILCSRIVIVMLVECHYLSWQVYPTFSISNGNFCIGELKASAGDGVGQVIAGSTISCQQWPVMACRRKHQLPVVADAYAAIESERRTSPRLP